MRKLAPHPLLQQLASGPGLSPHPHINPTKYSNSMNAIIEPSAMLAYHLKNIQQNHGYQLIISSMILLQKSLDAPILHRKILCKRKIDVMQALEKRENTRIY